MVYFDFWMRAFDEGTVKVTHEAELAYSSGYRGKRAVRTWREHVLKLQELGFIRVKPNGINEIGHVLIINPLLVCSNLKSQGNSLPHEWWSAFVQRASEIGAQIPGQAT